ncbi:hypothetical protein ACWD04_32290 [Streptomyces sp. NPDC002911]
MDGVDGSGDLDAVPTVARAVTAHRYGSETNDAVALVVAELAANSVTHGAVRGRGALLRLSHERDGLIRVEISDTRGERLPAPTPSTPPPWPGGAS